MLKQFVQQLNLLPVTSVNQTAVVSILVSSPSSAKIKLFAAFVKSSWNIVLLLCWWNVLSKMKWRYSGVIDQSPCAASVRLCSVLQDRTGSDEEAGWGLVKINGLSDDTGNFNSWSVLSHVDELLSMSKQVWSSKYLMCVLRKRIDRNPTLCPSVSDVSCLYSLVNQNPLQS